MSIIAPELVEGARRGDRHAFALLVEQMYPRGLRYAQQMLGNQQDAEEALQDSFVRVYDHIGSFQAGSAFEPWFFRILANRCRTLGAKRKRHFEIIEYEESPPDVVYNDRLDFELDEWRRDVDVAIAALPADQREAFLLRYVEEMSYDEMAQITGVRAATLRMRVSRACDALRARLREAVIHG